MNQVVVCIQWNTSPDRIELWAKIFDAMWTRKNMGVLRTLAQHPELVDRVKHR